MDALEAIRKRRSVRSFTGEPVPREDLETIVDAGRLAATGHNRQLWDFVVVTETDTVAALSAATPWLTQAPAVIAVVMDTSSDFWLEDAAAAVQNMMVAATALGYGSCWIEGQTRPHEAVFKTLLRVPAEKRLLTLVAVGVPRGWPSRQKRTVEDVLHWETFGNRATEG